MDRFEKSVVGFADSLPALKELLPGRQSYKLAELYSEELQNEDFEAHHALADVSALGRLIMHLKAGEIICKHT